MSERNNLDNEELHSLSQLNGCHPDESQKKLRQSSPIRLRILLIILGVSICFLGITIWQGNSININALTNRLPVGVHFSGSGTADNPYRIRTANNLARVATMVNSGTDFAGVHFRLENDIDLTDFLSPGRPGYNNGRGWQHIGRHMHLPFSGVFDGAGYTISGLWINRTSEPHIGLFGYITDGEIRNLHVEVAEGKSIAGGVSIGVLVGLFYGGVIENCSVSGVIRVETNRNSAGGGGMVGNKTGGAIITDSEADVNVYAVITSENGQIQAGGLVGTMSVDSSIIDSIARGNVSATAPRSIVGGLVGSNLDSSIINSKAYGDIAAYSTSDVNLAFGGGLVGIMAGRGNTASTISYSSATGSVTVDGGEPLAGGLVGYMQDSIVENSYAAGSVFAIGILEASSGGLIGSALEATMKNNHASGDVSSYSTSDDSSASGGGLVGFMENSTITYSSAIGNVSVNGGETLTGGLVGYVVNGSISNSYALGNVSATGITATYTGALIGAALEATVKNSYAAGYVFGIALEESIAGLVGWLDGNIENSFFDTETTGQVLGHFCADRGIHSEGVVGGRTTQQMMRQETFEGWDFENVWGIIEGQSYPFLISENKRGVRR